MMERHSTSVVSGTHKQQRSPEDTLLSVGDPPAPGEQIDHERRLEEVQQRHQLAEELLASEQRFRITFEQAPVGMAHVDLTGRWLLVNHYLCTLLGYTEVELLERTFHAVMLAEDLPTAFAHAQSMITGELHTYQQEMRFVRKDSTHVWVNLTVTLVRDCVGMPLYFIAVVEDLTDRMQAAHQRRLNQLKDQFIINVNHELRTPLTRDHLDS